MPRKAKEDVKYRLNAEMIQDAQKLLGKVPEANVFWCHDGQVFRNMKELADGMANMSDETFAYHSNAQKRDFSNWVRDIIRDEKLAQDLENAPNRTHAAIDVAQRIAFLTQPTCA